MWQNVPGLQSSQHKQKHTKTKQKLKASAKRASPSRHQHTGPRGTRAAPCAAALPTVAHATSARRAVRGSSLKQHGYFLAALRERVSRGTRAPGLLPTALLEPSFSCQQSVKIIR